VFFSIQRNTFKNDNFRFWIKMLSNIQIEIFYLPFFNYMEWTYHKSFIFPIDPGWEPFSYSISQSTCRTHVGLNPPHIKPSFPNPIHPITHSIWLAVGARWWFWGQPFAVKQGVHKSVRQSHKQHIKSRGSPAERQYLCINRVAAVGIGLRLLEYLIS